MTMQKQKLTFEHALYILLFLLALSVRLFNLDTPPLSDFEAERALQSWQAARGHSVDIGTNVAYFSLTTLLFFGTESSNFFARFWPVLFGSLLVLAPLGFRRLFGQKIALVIALGLAIDPGMVAISRLAGGPSLAIAFFVFACVFLYLQNPVWAGVFGGLALISGPSIFTGLAGFGISLGIGKLTGITIGLADFQKSESTEKEENTRHLGWIILGLTIILVATLFFRYPNGLGAVAKMIPAYLKGWITFSGVPVFQPLLAIVFFQPLALILGLIFAVRSWINGKNFGRWLSIWFLSATLITMLYPGRQVFDIAWALIPMWGLAAFELSRYLRRFEPISIALGLTAVVFVLLILFWLMSLNLAAANLTWLVVVIIPVLIALITFLVGLGWSWDSARSGLIWGLCVSLGVYIVSGVFFITHRLPNDPRILWSPGAGTVQADLLDDTLKELAIIKNGHTDWLDIVSVVDRPSLEWALRNFSDVRFISTLDTTSLPTVIISDDNIDLSQTMSYLGQDFIWAAQPGWYGALPTPWHRWATFHEGPIRYDKVVLWARGDLFPDSGIKETENAVISDDAEQTQEERNLK